MVIDAAFTELTTPRLVLRPWQPEHAGALLQAVRESIATLEPWLPWCHGGYNEADSVARIVQCQADWRDGSQFAFAIFDTHGTLLGSIGLNKFDPPNRRANLGYWVRTSAERKGIASEAARVVARFGFESLGLLRIGILAATDNIASRRCADKAGARFERVALKKLVFRGTLLDAAIYTLTPADLAQPAAEQSAAISS